MIYVDFTQSLTQMNLADYILLLLVLHNLLNLEHCVYPLQDIISQGVFLLFTIFRGKWLMNLHVFIFTIQYNFFFLSFQLFEGVNVTRAHPRTNIPPQRSWAAPADPMAEMLWQQESVEAICPKNQSKSSKSGFLIIVTMPIHRMGKK